MTTSANAPSRPATTRARWFAAELTMATHDLGSASDAPVELAVASEREGVGYSFAPSDDR